VYTAVVAVSGFTSLLLGLPLGAILGAAGSLTGIGGGFLLMPALLWLYPNQSAGALSVVSLTVVFFNALSGTVLSLRKETVRLRTGLAYGALSLPLVWLGSRLQSGFDRHTFDVAFGALLLAGAVFLAFKPASAQARTGRGAWLAGAGASLAIGLVSGFFGVGGGFLFVPLLAYGLRYPVTEATATSQLIVGLGAAWGLALTALAHPLPVDPLLVAGLVAGVLVGAPLGTAAAERWPGPVILRVLAALLALAALRFVIPEAP
jgi:uncharacterized membrane protein YfcA